MPVSKSKRAANDKWDKENMSTLACKVKKEDAIAFKAYSEKLGGTANGMLKNYVLSCIDNISRNECSQEKG